MNRSATTLLILALPTVACGSSGSGEPSVRGDQQVVSGGPARLRCTVEDPCEHGGQGDLEACVDEVTLSETLDGKVLLDVRRRSTVGDPEGDRPLRSPSDRPARLAGPKIAIDWEGGEHSVTLVQSGSKYIGEMTIDQDFLFTGVTCE
jgi:hypothetical protein